MIIASELLLIHTIVIIVFFIQLELVPESNEKMNGPTKIKIVIIGGPNVGKGQGSIKSFLVREKSYGNIARKDRTRDCKMIPMKKFFVEHFIQIARNILEKSTHHVFLKQLR